jgi:signal transduction histidine kinase/DNA-binding response OmpR family regulator
MPAAIIAPAVLGWLALQGRRAGMYDTAVAIALVDLASVVLFVALIIRAARSLDHADSDRQGAEAAREHQYLAAEQARGESRAVLDAAGDAMLLIAPDQRVRTVNQQFTRFFQFSMDSVIGQRIDALQVDLERRFAEPALLLDHILATYANTDQRYTAIVRQQWPEQREFALSSAPVHAGGVHLGRLYVFRDATLEREIDRMKSEFVSLVSHELRTPLTSIKGYVDLLAAGEVGDVSEEQREFLGIVQHNANRLVSLINDLLDLSRIESGTVELKRSPVDIATLIQGVVTMLRPQMEAKGQRITLNLPSSLPAISCDQNRIAQVVTNLLSNAYKYTAPGGAITLAVHPQGGTVRIDVQDTGIGMTPEEQTKLFTRFFRSSNRTAQEAGGTGLGLVITRSLVEMHGGEMLVSSTPGRGSIFSFTLPMPHLLPPEPLPPDLPRGQGRVLVVDDEPSHAELLKRLLQRDGYTVSVAHTGADALRMAHTECPDLIALDLVLPDTDGLTVLDSLKRNPVTAAIPVILVSGADDTGQGRALGAVDYLTKPLHMDMLVRRVTAILRDSGAVTVLVVDEDAAIRALLAGHLRRLGYRVAEASSADEAVGLAKRTPPGLVLIGLRMPNVSGLAVLHALRADPATRDIPAMLMTDGLGVPAEGTPQ